MQKFKIAIDGTGTMTMPVRINYLRKILRGGDLREFNELVIQNNGTTNTHLNITKEGLLGYLPILTTYTSRSAQCADQCVNPGNFISRDLMHN